jgi:hypothetical protein
MNHIELYKTKIDISRITSKNLRDFFMALKFEPQEVEGSQRNEYIQWLKDNVGLPGGVRFLQASGKQDLLSAIVSMSSRYVFNGITDIVISDAGASDIRIVIEPKKRSIVPSNFNQAYAKLVSANVLSKYPVVVVLTDLKDK